MTLLTKEAILSANDRATSDVEVAEWSGTVRVSTMSASERDKWEAETYGDGKPKTEDFRARFVALCLVDEAGNRMFTDKEVGELGKKSAAALQRVFAAAQKLNALTADEAEKIEGN